MRFRRPLLSLGLAALLVAVPALADTPAEHAPSDQYDPFDKNSVAIVDRKTKIRWQRATSSQTPYLVAPCPGSQRLPTVKELLTIVDEEPHLEYEFGKNQVKLIDPYAFPSTPIDAPYWTQTPGSDPVTQVLGVDFTTGMIVDMPKTGTGRVRCME